MVSIQEFCAGTGKNIVQSAWFPDLLLQDLETDTIGSVHGTSMLENNTHVTGGKHPKSMDETP